MQPNLRRDVVKSIRRRVDPEEYHAIRKLWIAHSAAEDAHDIPGLMATLRLRLHWRTLCRCLRADGDRRGTMRLKGRRPRVASRNEPSA